MSTEINRTVSNDNALLFLQLYYPVYRLVLTLCTLGNLSRFFLLLTVLRIYFLKELFWKHFQQSNSLDQDEARRSVGPELGSNCLQRSPADDNILNYNVDFV